MSSSGLRCFLVAIFCAATHADQPAVAFAEKHVDFLDNYCMSCHDAETEKGRINLEDLPFQIGTVQHAELWQKVLNTLNSGEMPPEKKKQPKGNEKADFLDDLANTLVQARKVLSDSGGKITMRRLNRREYQNTIKHLTGITVPVDTLPSDEGHGFDTTGSGLLSPATSSSSTSPSGAKRLMMPLCDKRHTSQKSFARRSKSRPTGREKSQ